MKKNRFSVLILTLILTLNIVLTACASEETEPDSVIETTEATAETAEEYEPLPDEDFNAKTFTMFLFDYMKEEHQSDDLTGDVLNDAVYNRNSKISAEYNIAMQFLNEPYAKYAETVRKTILAQDSAFDLLAFHAVSGASIVLEKLFTDWKSVPVISDNLDKPWWNKSAVDNLSIGKKVYFIAGDIGYHYIGHVQTFLFNKKLFTDINLDFPYEAVQNGTWTYENFENIIKSGNEDINGDGTIKKEDDRFGFMTMGLFADVMYFFNFGGKIVEKDENDFPVLVLNSPRNASVIETGYRWFIDNNSPLTKYSGNDDYSVEESHVAFKDDRVLILGTNLKNIRVLRDMESDFGIIPYPKFDQSQENYISIIDGAVPLTIMPITAAPEFVGLITEALARESYKNITPAFYEFTLEQKYSRDEVSAVMLKIIRDTTYFDMGYIFNFGGSGFISMTMLAAKNKDFASFYAKNEKVIQKAIDKFIEVYNQE
ncbi:MAG: hypothetical protein ACYC00_07575 [Eubacteriales bacterium]